MRGECIITRAVNCLVALILVAGGILTGCQYQGLDANAWGNAYGNQGYHAFLKGDYPLAHRYFTLLAQEAKNPKSAASGIYGRACVEMVTAGNTQAFYSAMDPLLQRLGAGSDGVNDFINEPSGLLIKAMARGSELMEKERAAYQETLEAAEEKGKNQEMKIRELKKQITILTNQISALERIDKSLQEKRKDQ